MKVLIADDDQSYATLIQEMLDLAGHTSLIARDGNEAVEFASGSVFDLAIIDIFMPNKDGIETIRDLRKMHPDMKLLAISGIHRLESNYLKAILMLGADASLSKPFTQSDLVDLISSIVE
jgi:DNA-binding response OmpR family regulator